MPNFISEDQLEQALLQRLQHLHGFDVIDCQTTDPEDPNDGSRRASGKENARPARQAPHDIGDKRGSLLVAGGEKANFEIFAVSIVTLPSLRRR